MHAGVREPTHSSARRGFPWLASAMAVNKHTLGHDLSGVGARRRAARRNSHPRRGGAAGRTTPDNLQSAHAAKASIQPRVKHVARLHPDEQ